MKLIHFKKSGEKSFKCCDKELELFDCISCTDHVEMVLKKCSVCNKQFKEEVVFGAQKLNINGHKDKERYPHYSTFSV